MMSVIGPSLYLLQNSNLSAIVQPGPGDSWLRHPSAVAWDNRSAAAAKHHQSDAPLHCEAPERSANTRRIKNGGNRPVKKSLTGSDVKYGHALTLSPSGITCR